MHLRKHHSYSLPAGRKKLFKLKLIQFRFGMLKSMYTEFKYAFKSLVTVMFKYYNI